MTTGLTYSQYVTQIATLAVVEETDPAFVTKKTCCACGEAKDVAAFNKLSESKDGLAYACRECTRVKMAAWRKANPDRDRAAKSRWAEANAEKIAEKGKRYYAENKEKHKAACKNWADRNKPLIAQRFARRRAAKRNATPSWLSAIEAAQIQEIYDVAAALSVQTGVTHHVDHIHPLQGRGFMGLHVPWNLRVIPASENHRKLNKLPAEDAHMGWGVDR